MCRAAHGVEAHRGHPARHDEGAGGAAGAGGTCEWGRNSLPSSLISPSLLHSKSVRCSPHTASVLPRPQLDSAGREAKVAPAPAGDGGDEAASARHAFVSAKWSALQVSHTEQETYVWHLFISSQQSWCPPETAMKRCPRLSLQANITAMQSQLGMVGRDAISNGFKIQMMMTPSV